jgi:hypothetical protein
MYVLYLQIILYLLSLFNITQSIDVVGTNGCTASACVFANPWMRFGTGTQTSINAQGLFLQPFYFSPLTNTWYKLTYSSYPLDTAIGTGTTGPNWSGTTVADLYSLTPSGSITDYSAFTVTSSDSTKSIGYGRIVTNRTFTINGQSIIMQNIFTLDSNATFVKINNRIYNNAVTPISNVYIWVGTRDDFVGTSDSNMKTRGNIVTNSFTALTSVGQSSNAIMITNPTEGVLFYSDSIGVNTVFDRCCAFSNSYNLNPSTASIATTTSTDGSYAAVLPLGNIPVGGSAAITWYYAAGVISSLSNVVQDVAIAQQAEASPSQTTISTSSFTASITETSSKTESESASQSASKTESETQTQTASQTETQTASQTETQTASQTETQTVTTTQTSTNSVTTSNTPNSTQSSHYFITAWPSITSTPNSTPTTSPTYMISMYASIQFTPSYTSSPLFMIVPYPSISSSPFPQPIVVEDKTNYSTQIILAGTAIGTAFIAAIGYALSNLIKSNNINKQQDEEDKKEQIKAILYRLLEESKQYNCELCQNRQIETEIYTNELLNLTKT